MKLLGLLVLVLTSCQQSYRENNPYTYHKKDQKFFQKYVNQESLPEKVDLQKVRALHFPDARPLLIIGLDHEVDHNSRHRHIEPNGKGHLSQPAMDPPFSSNPFAKCQQDQGNHGDG